MDSLSRYLITSFFSVAEKLYQTLNFLIILFFFFFFGGGGGLDSLMDVKIFSNQVHLRVHHIHVIYFVSGLDGINLCYKYLNACLVAICIHILFLWHSSFPYSESDANFT